VRVALAGAPVFNGSQHSKTFPLRKVRVFDSFRGSPSLTPSNSVLPLAENAGDLVFVDQSLLRQQRNNAAASHDHHVYFGFSLQLSHFRVRSLFTSVMLFHGALSSVLENTTFHPFGHDGVRFDRKRYRPQFRHEEDVRANFAPGENE
jgi:hypothetical protein